MLYHKNGTVKKSEFQINSVTEQNEIESSVVGLSDGGFLVVWVGSRSIESSSIQAQKFDSEGEKVDSELEVDFTAGFYNSGPRVAALENGIFIITWQ